MILLFLQLRTAGALRLGAYHSVHPTDTAMNEPPTPADTELHSWDFVNMTLGS